MRSGSGGSEATGGFSTFVGSGGGAAVTPGSSGTCSFGGSVASTIGATARAPLLSADGDDAPPACCADGGAGSELRAAARVLSCASTNVTPEGLPAFTSLAFAGAWPPLLMPPFLGDCARKVCAWLVTSWVSRGSLRSSAAESASDVWASSSRTELLSSMGPSSFEVEAIARERDPDFEVGVLILPGCPRSLRRLCIPLNVDLSSK
mmetsp:Transcript_38624/g.111059  ORF Transcript_38624/g.111059 Transcript_38624/m.111059 type:complete len:206 (-) Transcript_38624:941-1558(-)